MNSLEYRGEWWLAEEDKEDRVAGVLEFNPNDGGELELIGAFDGFGHSHSREVDFINGRTTDGKAVTLQDCLIDYNSISGTLQTQSCKVGMVFTGVLFSEDELELKKVCVSFPLLEMWTTTNTVHTPEGQVIGAEISEFETKVAQLDNATIRLNITQSHQHRQWKGIEITQQAYFCIELDEPNTFDVYLNDYIRHLQHFICLAVGEPVTPVDLAGYYEHDGGTHKTDIVYQVSHRPEVPDKKHPSRVQFYLHDINFEEALQNWFEDAEGGKMLHNLYFGTQYNESMFQEYDFLSLVIALEHYQSYLFPDHRLMAKDEYDDLRKQIHEMIPDDAAAKKRIDDLLRSIGNQESLHDQLSMVLYEYEDILEDLIDIEQIIRDAKNSRHNIAHGLENNYDLNELSDTARKLRVVIESILLKTVGLDPDHIKGKLQKNRSHILNR
jgi:hypothetical protein